MNRTNLTPSRPSSLTPPKRGGRRGFALPAAILAMAALGVLVTGGIQIATQEGRIGRATVRTVEAFYVAETGMNNILATWRPSQSNLTEWGAPAALSGNTAGGSWTAQIRQVDDRLFYIRTTGSVNAGGGATATRSMGIMARVVTANLSPPAALLTMGTVRVQGAAQINGNDQVPAGWGASVCPDPLVNLPGVITNTAGNITGNGTVNGTPSGHVRDASVTDATFTNFGGMTWAELTSLATIVRGGGNINGTGPTLNANGTCNTSNQLNWGDPSNPAAPCGNYFPIIHIQGSANIQSGGTGQGILLVDGDLDLRGNFFFAGIIIVQGSVGIQGGGNRVSGGMIARNADIELQTFIGSSILQQSSCAVNRAIMNNSALTQVVPLGLRSWVDITGASF